MSIQKLKLEKLAEIVGKINTIATEATRDVQYYDGYTPHIFYDLGDYIDAICNDEMLLSEFQAQMTKCIPHKAHTAQIWVTT